MSQQSLRFGVNLKLYTKLIIICIFLVLGILYTNPLIFNFNDGLPYDRTPPPGYEIVPVFQGDYLQLFYHFWLFKDALCGNIPFFSDPYQFSTIDSQAAFSKQGFPFSLIFALFSIFGNVFAYNSLVILSFALAGFSMFLLAYYYTKDTLSSFISGIIFSLAPARVSQTLGGHANGFLWFLIPLAIYLIISSYKKNSIGYAIFAGLCIYCMAIMELHLIFYFSLFIMAFIPFYIILNKKKTLSNTSIIIGSFIVLSLISVFFLKRMILDTSIASSGRDIPQITLFSPNIKDIFRRTNTLYETYIYIGIVPALLFCLYIPFVFYSFLKKKVSNAPTVVFFSLTFIVTYILSLGPNLTIFPIYNILYKIIPFFKYPRVPARIIVLSFTSLALLCAFALSSLKKRNAKFLSIVLLLGIAIDYYPARPTGICLVDTKNNAYDIVKENRGNHKLLELPLWPGDSSWSAIYQYSVTASGTKMINGYSPAVSRKYIEEIFTPLYNVNLGEIREKEYQLLLSQNVKYIMFHKEAFPLKVSPYPFYYSVNNLMNSPYLKFITHDHPVYLFEVLQKPKTNQNTFNQSCIIGKHYEAEYLKHQTGSVIDNAVLGNINTDKPGNLTYGPWRKYPTGKYNALFRLKTDNISNQDIIATIEVSSENGDTVLAQRDLHGYDFAENNTYQDFSLSYFISIPTRLEYRTYFHKQANLWVDYVLLTFQNQNDPLNIIETDKLFHIGRIEEDPNASEGMSLHALASKDPSEHLISGPYRKYPKGNYTVSFRLKLDSPTNKDIVTLSVSSHSRTKTLSAKTLNGKDFSKTGIYQNFSLDFNLEESTVIEFLVKFHRACDIWVDNITITKK